MKNLEGGALLRPPLVVHLGWRNALWRWILRGVKERDCVWAVRKLSGDGC